MNDVPTWTVAVAATVGLLLVICVLGRFAFGYSVAKKLDWGWAWRLGVGMTCLLVPHTMPAVYQQHRGVTSSRKDWCLRGVIAAALLAAAILVGDSQWMRTSDFFRTTFCGLVFILSTNAVSVEGTTIIDNNGMPFEITGVWSTALFLGAFGASLGLMFLRHTVNAVIGLGWLGLFVGAFASADYYARAIDCSACMDFPGYGLLNNASYQAHFYLPIHAAPWFAVWVLSRFVMAPHTPSDTL